MSFGETLKQKRLERGWTKEYVAERTHIMTRAIDALETETLKKIPAPIYGRGFIKQYCALLGIDPQPLIDSYMAMVSGNAGKTKPVTRPAVRELPERPLEPIHTGAHRTLPPKGPEPVQPTEGIVHKIVEPAEESFTAVPKPEVFSIVEDEPPAPPVTPFRTSSTPMPTPDPAPMPPPPTAFVTPPQETQPTPPPAQPAPVTPVTPAEDLFTLAGDTLPPTPAPTQPTPPPATEIHHPHRAIFSKSFEQEKRERTIVPQRDRTDELRPESANGRRIFSPQQPASDPTNHPLRPVGDVFKKLAAASSSLVTRATRPKVKRLHGDEGRYITPRMLYQALLVFIILLGMTGLVFLFRYVFRLADSAEPEYGILPDTPSGQFELRQVGTPPEPFFD